MKGRYLTLIVAILAFLLSDQSTLADESFEPISGVTILSATTTPAAVGETSRLQFRLENFSSADLTLIGVRSELAESGAIMIADGDGGSTVAAQLLVKEEETLDFQTSHIWLELRDLKALLEDGDTMPFELIFRNGVLPGRAHVHPPPH